MKKIALLLIFVLLAGMILADDIAIAGGNTVTAKAKTIIVYDPIRHTETASNVFMCWAGLSLASGAVIAISNNNWSGRSPVGQPNAESNGFARGIGIGNFIYGAVETALVVININYVDKITDPEKARLKMIDDCGWHAWSGVGHLVVGTALALLGKSHDLQGIGVAMALQGSFIAISNTMNYAIAKDPVNIRDWNAGLEVKFLLASTSF